MTLPDTATAQPIRVLPHDERVTDNEIVPDSLQNLLGNVRDSLKRNYFAIGDAACVLLEEARKQGFRIKRVSGRDVFVSQDRIFQAIGNYCGKSGRTVRYYYETARFYPVDVREEFDHLDFAMFVVARVFGGQWREVLEYASVNPQADAETVKHFFLQKAAGDASLPADGDDTHAGEISPDRATDVVGGLSRLLESMSGFVKLLRLPDNLQARVSDLVDEFRLVLTEISQEMKAQQEDRKQSH